MDEYATEPAATSILHRDDAAIGPRGRPSESAYTGSMAAPIETPSAELRRELWNARVEADMRQRYFARMAQRAHVRDRALRVAIFFTSSATGVTAVGGLGLGSELFAFATAVLAAASFTLELGSVAMKHTGFAVDWGRIHQETLDLWTESERGGLSHDEVRTSLRAIERRIEPIDQQSITYRVDARVLAQCFDQAETYALAR